MSQLIKRSIGQIKCQAVGHDITIDDEDKLYIAPSRSIETKCSVCEKPVRATMNPTNEDEYFVEEI